MKKKCEYWIGKGWVGKGPIEENCWTKAKNNKKSTVKVTKQADVEEASSDDDDDVRIGVVRVKLTWTETNKYQFDTGKIYHTMNKQSCLTDIQEIKLKVEKHNGSMLVCTI